MTKKLLFLAAFLCISGSFLNAQRLSIDVGMNAGGSMLLHQTRFETTALYNEYLVIKEVFKKQGQTYSWDQYREDFKLRSYLIQPRFGFSALLRYGNLPFFAAGEFMSSPSSYQKVAVGAIIGVGQDFYMADSTTYISFRGGYKFVQDFGYGSKTLVNSVGDEEIRKNLATFFDPKQPLGDPFGKLFILHLGIGRALGVDERLRVGVDLFGELDLTAETTRESRMTNFGALAYARFRLNL